MKTICLIRHAKTHPAGWQEDDFDRKLTEKGKEDAGMMAMALKKKEIFPEILISSPARRTRKTCNIFAAVFNLYENQIQWQDALYAAPYPAYLEVLQSLDNSIDKVSVIGHNPGITDFANWCCRHIRLDHMPTASVFVFQADINVWKNLHPDNCGFLFFLHPNLS